MIQRQEVRSRYSVALAESVSNNREFVIPAQKRRTLEVSSQQSSTRLEKIDSCQNSPFQIIIIINGAQDTWPELNLAILPYTMPTEVLGMRIFNIANLWCLSRHQLGKTFQTFKLEKTELHRVAKYPQEISGNRTQTSWFL